MDWSDPIARLRLAERLGPAEYNRQHLEHLAASVRAVVNGRGIRAVASRFGQLYAIDGTNEAFACLEQAKARAADLEAPLDP